MLVYRQSRISFVFTLLMALLVLAFNAASAQAVTGVDALERSELRLINNYRAAHHLPRLLMDARLTRAATWHATQMARRDYFSHTDFMGRDPFKRLNAFHYPANTWRGENIAAGNDAAQPTFVQWRNSAPHRANLLNRNYRAIGIARFCLTTSTYNCYWVTNFGSRVIVRVI